MLSSEEIKMNKSILYPEILLKVMGSQLKFGWPTAQSEHIAKWPKEVKATLNIS